MKGRGGVKMPLKLQQIVAALPDNERKPAPKAKHINEIWIKRGGDGQTSGSGPSGWKLRPAKRLARSLAERTHGKKWFQPDAYAAAAAAAAAAYAAADAARDKSLSDYAEAVVQMLVAMNVPGVQWLPLTE